MKLTKVMKVLVLFSMFVLLLPTLLVEAKIKPILGVSTVYENRATTVDVSVFVTSDEKIAGGSFDLEYAPSQLTVRDLDVKAAGQFASPAYLTSTNGAEVGKISMAIAKVSGKGELIDGTILTFKAKINKANDSIDLNFKNVHFYSEDGKAIDVQLLNGQVKPFDGEERVHEGFVKGDKVWTINLSSAYNASSLNGSSVLVKSGTRVIETEVTAINATSFSVKPKVNYPRGTYILEVSEQLRSNSGGKLKKPVRHTFKVQ